MADFNEASRALHIIHGIIALCTMATALFVLVPVYLIFAFVVAMQNINFCHSLIPLY